MSRQRAQSSRRGPQLPTSLQRKLGIPQDVRKNRTQVSDRKQQRQGSRGNGRDRPNKRRKLEHRPSFEESKLDDDLTDEDIRPSAQVNAADAQYKQRNEILAPTKGSKTTIDREEEDLVLEEDSEELPHDSSLAIDLDEDDWDELSRGSREYSPEITLDAASNTYKQRQAEDDAEILALEAKLGVRGKQGGRNLDDEFSSLLEGLDGRPDVTAQKRIDQNWLEQKRKLNSPIKSENVSDQDSDTDASRSDGSVETADISAHEDDFSGFEEDSKNSASEIPEVTEVKPVDKRIKENPFLPPLVSSTTNAGKYVPPSLRKVPQTEREALEKLRRQAQGYLNRLSEANIVSIVDEFEKLYLSNPRQDITTTIIDLILTAFTIPSAQQNTFIILHAAFVAALYKLLGPDFGAELIRRLVETIDQYRNDKTTGKQGLNLLSLLSNMFTFGVVSSTLVYDHIRLLLTHFGEESAELLLRLVRDCGPQLRADDPTSLKGIVQQMNDITAKMSANGEVVNVRTKVMMDTITNLKNNKTRQATNAAGVTGEHLTRMKKALGSLNSRNLRATEPLGIGRDDILRSDKQGKWWLVGASWKGNQKSDAQQQEPRTITSSNAKQYDRDEDPEDIDYLTLARHHKLTTPTQRSIFTAILSADDAADALQRLSKLRLSRKQEPEIPKVLLRLCRAEPSHNVFYTALAKLLLRDGRRYKFAFEVALWKFFEDIGERSSDDDEDAAHIESTNVPVHELANVAYLYATLVGKGSLGIDILKTLNIGFLSDNGALWLELFFTSLLCSPKMKGNDLTEVFAATRPDVGKQLAYFLGQHVRKSEFLTTKDEKIKAKKAILLVEAALLVQERNEAGEEL